MLDALLVLLGVLLIALCLYRRFIGAVFLLAGAYVSTLVALLSYQEVAYRLQAIGNNTIWFEGLVFIFLYLLTLVIFFVGSRVAYPDTSTPKLGFLDALLGAVVGFPVAVVSMALVYRAFGYMVSQRWEPFQTYSSVFVAWAGSRIGPMVDQLFSAYLYLIYPFFIRQGLPPILQ
jgi:uncharacterized membrane protein required for colicin V production